VSLISYGAVDAKDPAFENPSKPIGPAYTETQVNTFPFPTRKTAKGYRRVVASPRPVTIVERREIEQLIERGFIIICCGGGGIPVIREGRSFCGVDAVIDKDLASAKLAEEIGGQVFLIATDVPGVALHYGKPDEEYLRTVSLNEAEKHLEEGHFPQGSMGPKMEAVAQFLRGDGQKAIICSVKDIEKALAGEAGTMIHMGGRKS